jgi:hypothetical protein
MTVIARFAAADVPVFLTVRLVTGDRNGFRYASPISPEHRCFGVLQSH